MTMDQSVDPKKDMAHSGGQNLNVHGEMLQLTDQFGVEKLK